MVRRQLNAPNKSMRGPWNRQSFDDPSPRGENVSLLACQVCQTIRLPTSKCNFRTRSHKIHATINDLQWEIRRDESSILQGRRCMFGRVAAGDRETARGVPPSSPSTSATTIPSRPSRPPMPRRATDSGGGFPDAFRSWQSPFERS